MSGVEIIERLKKIKNIEDIDERNLQIDYLVEDIEMYKLNTL